MKFFYLYCLIVLFSLFCLNASAQIAGIAATKNVAFSAHPIPPKEAEFEPTYNFFRNITASDSTNISSNITWRLSYGLTKGLELGLNTGPGFSSSCMAIKYAIYEKENLSLSLMGGLGLMLGNRNIAAGENLMQGYGLGLISTHDFTEKSSVDLNAQYFRNIGSTDSFILNAEYGVYPFKEKVIFVVGAGLHSYKSADFQFWAIRNLLVGLELYPYCFQCFLHL